MNKIKILIVDDHFVVRNGLKLLFASENQFDVVADFNSGIEAINFIKNNEVDVVVTDISMPIMNGIELIQKIKEIASSINIMVLTMHLDENYITDAIESGAKAYLVKDSKEEEIIDAVKIIYNNQIYLTKSVSDVLAKLLISKSKTDSDNKAVGLTKREKEILKEIVNGLSNKMISDKLFISERTVSVHRYNLMKKLKAKNSADLVRISIERKILL